VNNYPILSRTINSLRGLLFFFLPKTDIELLTFVQRVVNFFPNNIIGRSAYYFSIINLPQAIDSHKLIFIEEIYNTGLSISSSQADVVIIDYLVH